MGLIYSPPTNFSQHSETGIYQLSPLSHHVVHMFTSLSLNSKLFAMFISMPFQKLTDQVIQFVTFSSPNDGGHQQPLSSGHVFTHYPKKVTIADSPGTCSNKTSHAGGKNTPLRVVSHEMS